LFCKLWASKAVAFANIGNVAAVCEIGTATTEEAVTVDAASFGTLEFVVANETTTDGTAK